MYIKFLMKMKAGKFLERNKFNSKISSGLV